MKTTFSEVLKPSLTRSLCSRTFALAISCLAVVQMPAKADEADARKALPDIKLPPGFEIELFADIPGARHMAVSPDGETVIVGTTGRDVWRLVVSNGQVREKHRFSPQSVGDRLNGPCFAPDGTLFIASPNRVTAFRPLPGGKIDEEHPKVIAKEGALVPEAEVGSYHDARVCRVGPDQRLYITIGQRYNVPPPQKLDLYNAWGIGGIVRYRLDGTAREVFARGIRNSVGLDFNPTDGTLWFTDNQVDGMGDDVPVGEINHAARAGQNFGFPWYGGGHTRTKEYANTTPPDGVVFPTVEEVAHAADLGIIFYRGSTFPKPWRGIYSAQHGSWDRSVPVGARVMFTPIENDSAGKSQPFAEGWNQGDGSYLGRPVDVAELADGSLLVSDDQNGVLYRIAYK